MGKNGSKVGCWIAIAILALLLFGSFLTNIGLTTALFSSPSARGNDYPVDQMPEFNEVWSHGYGDAKVARIELAGVIMRGRRERIFGYEPDMVESILAQIRAATNDREVRAILLEVDSPGGAVTPSDEIYAALQRFKREDDQRVVVVLIRGVGASGAYYAAMAGDYVMAEPTSIVGSVGVIMQTINIKALGEKIGLSSVTIASGENKDMLNPLEEVDPQHVAMLQELVDGMQERFASIVVNARGLDGRELLDGRVFSAEQAAEARLIDGVGYLQDAIDQLKRMLGVEDVHMIRYQEELGFFDMFMAAKMPQLPDFSAMQSPRFLYLWNP
ncbi:MAG: signal peptide peptidase SppA [Pontiella sp.]|nr:signal peptide peptidase SppA [Pontiella sp.]